MHKVAVAIFYTCFLPAAQGSPLRLCGEEGGGD
jgi:hypothetical protein